MSIIDLSQASLRAEGPDYSKFDFAKGNNTARIMIPNMRVAQAFVHSIYRSEALMVADDKGRLKPSWENSTYAGTFQCTGDFATVAGSPSYGDPANCAACASLHSGPRIASAPKKMFALNVLRYQTKPNSFDIAGQGITVELWKHGNDRNIKPLLLGLSATKKPISQLDFMIETDGSAFKKLAIQFMHPAAYGDEGNEALKAAIVAAMENLYSEETLSSALGEKVSKEQLAANVAQAQAQVQAASQPPTAESEAAVANVFAAVAAPAAAVAAVPSETPAAELGKIDVASIDSLL